MLWSLIHKSSFSSISDSVNTRNLYCSIASVYKFQPFICKTERNSQTKRTIFPISRFSIYFCLPLPLLNVCMQFLPALLPLISLNFSRFFPIFFSLFFSVLFSIFSLFLSFLLFLHLFFSILPSLNLYFYIPRPLFFPRSSAVLRKPCPFPFFSNLYLLILILFFCC